MRRADRLFQIIRLLQQRRTATTAAHIADKLGVSERTVYRDIRDLVGTGTPIDGEAGVGYRIRPGYDLPPLMFSRANCKPRAQGVVRVGDPVGAGRCDLESQRRAAAHALLADAKMFADGRARTTQATHSAARQASSIDDG
jgi:predicted DNA-binding transcriptional regulator YafY